MRKVIKEIKVYSVDDLMLPENENLKNRILEQNRTEYVEYYEWWDYAYERHTENLKEKGFDNVDIQFSGFWSQGDGARIQCEISFLEASILFKDKFKVPDDFDFGICGTIRIYANNNHYCHFNTLAIEYEYFENVDHQYEYMIVHETLSFIKDVSGKLYSDLQNEYEYLTSDDYILSNFKESDTEFTENANFFIETEKGDHDMADTLELFFDDLTEDAKQRVIDFLGENGNYDVAPLAIIETGIIE